MNRSNLSHGPGAVRWDAQDMVSATSEQRKAALQHLRSALFTGFDMKRRTSEFQWAKEALYPYMVGEWGSHPDSDNDDCHTGSAHKTAEGAASAYMAAAENPEQGTFFVSMDGPDISLVAAVDKPGRCHGDDGEWARERAHQAGMLGGVHAYNDAMGWS